MPQLTLGSCTLPLHFKSHLAPTLLPPPNSSIELLMISMMFCPPILKVNVTVILSYLDAKRAGFCLHKLTPVMVNCLDCIVGRSIALNIVNDISAVTDAGRCFACLILKRRVFAVVLALWYVARMIGACACALGLEGALWTANM
jgi:hypothetical protein